MSPTARSSFWIRTFEVARATDGWVKVGRLYTQATAMQLTSDIVNAAHRHPSTIRVRGMAPGEEWDARWEPAGDDLRGDHVVWVRLIRGGLPRASGGTNMRP